MAKTQFLFQPAHVPTVLAKQVPLYEPLQSGLSQTRPQYMRHVVEFGSDTTFIWPLLSTRKVLTTHAIVVHPILPHARQPDEQTRRPEFGPSNPITQLLNQCSTNSCGKYTTNRRRHNRFMSVRLSCPAVYSKPQPPYSVLLLTERHRGGIGITACHCMRPVMQSTSSTHRAPIAHGTCARGVHSRSAAMHRAHSAYCPYNWHGR